MMNRKPLIALVNLLSFFAICNLASINAQMDPNSKAFAIAIDSMFPDAQDMTVPGGAIIVMKGENIVLTKNYGAANLAYGKAFDKHTLFPLEGFTEQLVIFSLFQLEKKGLLSLDDSINKYLPDLGFSKRITLSHLLNHTSEFPMLSSLRLMAGWNYSDPFTNDDFLELTKKVSSDLDPDKAFNHNHGGIKILMMVIEKVSEKPFSDYASANIFAPLGMKKTYLKNKNHPNDSNNATGYTNINHGYLRVNPVAFEVMCPTTYSTQIDFQKWMANVQTKKFGGAILDRMDESLTVNGKLQERTYGVYVTGQYQYRNYLGQDEFFMRNTNNGFSWMWLRLSQSELSVMAVGNLDTYIGPKVNGIADLIGDYQQPIYSDSNDESEPVKLSQQELELCEGIYWNEDHMYTTEITIQDGQLYHADTDNGFNFLMTPITKTLFLTPYGGTVEFSNLGGQENKMSNVIPNGRVFDYKEYEVPTIGEEDKSKYEGVYSSDVLEAYYRIVWKDGKLVMKRSRKADLVLSPIGKNKFRTDDIDFRLIEFEKEVNSSFQNMNISNPSLSKIPFQRI